MDNRTEQWRSVEQISIGPRQITRTRAELMALVFDSADGFVWSRTEWATGAPSSAVMGSVLLYCFTLNVCGSEDIVEKLQADPTVRYLAAGQTIHWQDIHEFRRRNAGVFREALTRIFCALEACAPAEAREEVDARLRQAIRADSYVLDL